LKYAKKKRRLISRLY